MITLPIWAFVLCILGPVVIAAIASAAAMVIYIGKGMWG